ncbi:MAG: hypothetical protein D6778_00320 [Nitrospirae bacterium]|nr:MAG: hypothetical protein D6778_00320 [Nitrospirota bacterium]
MEKDSKEIDTGRVFSHSVQVLKERPSIVVPFLGANLISSIIYLLTVALFMDSPLPQRGLPRGQIFIAFVIGIALQSMAFGMSTLMAWNHVKGIPDDLWQSLRATIAQAFQLITAGLLLGTATAVGIFFFVLPGLFLAFFFMFTFFFIMVKRQHIFEAMKESFVLVNRNFLQSLKLFLLIVALSILVAFTGVVLMRASLVGQFLNALVVSVLFGLTATMLVVFYKIWEEFTFFRN